MKDEVITVRLTTTTLEAAKCVAEFHSITLPELVRKAVDDYICNDYILVNATAIKNALSAKWKKVHE